MVPAAFDRGMTGSRPLRHRLAIPLVLLATACGVAAAGATGSAPFVETFATRAGLRERWHVSEYDNQFPGNGGTLFRPSNVTHSAARGGSVRLRLTGEETSAGLRASGAELVARRSDFHFGRYRFLVRVPDARSLSHPHGFVLGLFVYQVHHQQPANEIDIEFLRWQGSRDVAGRVFFVAHTPTGSHQPCVEQGTACVPHPPVSRPRNAAGRLVWYGFDWTPERVTWFVDHRAVRTIQGAQRIPQQPGRLIVNTWAGVEEWGGAAPPPGTQLVSEIHEVRYTPMRAGRFTQNAGGAGSSADSSEDGQTNGGDDERR
jgi:hypothetical protein